MRLLKITEKAGPIMRHLPPHMGVLGGTGNLGQAIVRRLVKVKKEGFKGDILVSHTGRDPSRMATLKQLGIREASSQEIMQTCGVTFGCVKPGVAPTVLKDAPSWQRPPDSVFIPFFAATTPSDTARQLGSGKGLVNGMTGLGTEIGAGVTLLCAHPEANDKERLLAEYACSLLGDVHWLKDDQAHLLHLATSIVGCAPAYFAYVVNAVQEKAQELGIIDPQLAEKIVRSTMLATGKLMNEKNIPAATLMAQVATKGGVTRGGLDKLDAAGTGKLLGDVVEANVARCEAIRETIINPALTATTATSETLAGALNASTKTPQPEPVAVAPGSASPNGFLSKKTQETTGQAFCCPGPNPDSDHHPLGPDYQH